MTSLTRGTLVCVVLAFGMWALSGCALMTPTSVEVTKAMLNLPPVDLPQNRACGTTLLVFPPQTQSIFDTTQMAYTTHANQVTYFSRHEWGETPSQMLLPLLTGAMRGTQCFRAVVNPPDPFAEARALRTQVDELL